MPISAQQSLLAFCNFRRPLALWQRRTSQSPTVPQRGRSLSDYTCITLFPCNNTDKAIQSLCPRPRQTFRRGQVLLFTPPLHVCCHNLTLLFSTARSKVTVFMPKCCCFLVPAQQQQGKISPKLLAGQKPLLLWLTSGIQCGNSAQYYLRGSSRLETRQTVIQLPGYSR